VRRELELAHDLQLRCPRRQRARPSDLAVRCRSATGRRGLANLLSLHGDRVGVMIGDVSSHGFGAALIMASPYRVRHSRRAAERRGTYTQAQSPPASWDDRDVSLAAVRGHRPGGRQHRLRQRGHPHTFLVRGATGSIIRLEATYPAGQAVRRPGDRQGAWQRREDVLVSSPTASPTPPTTQIALRRARARHVRCAASRQVALEAISPISPHSRAAPSADDRTLLIARV
jgi:hypothetical protein